MQCWLLLVREKQHIWLFTRRIDVQYVIIEQGSEIQSQLLSQDACGDVLMPGVHLWSNQFRGMLTPGMNRALDKQSIGHRFLCSDWQVVWKYESSRQGLKFSPSSFLLSFFIEILLSIFICTSIASELASALNHESYLSPTLTFWLFLE